MVASFARVRNKQLMLARLAALSPLPPRPATARFRTGAYGFWRAHLRVLLRAADVPDTEDALAEMLLADPAACDLPDVAVRTNNTAITRPSPAMPAAVQNAAW